MTTTIEIYYSFQSPYSYLALDPIYALEQDKSLDVDLLWQPFSAKAAGQQVPPVPVNPDKLSYIFEDAKRSAQEMSLPLVFPESWPESEFEPSRITRGAIVANDMGVLMEYNYKVFNKWWGMGQDPNDENFMNELCDDLDIELGEFLSKLSSSDARERVKGVYKRGKKLGVFDTPTFVIGQERIVGIDKIPYIVKRLKGELPKFEAA